MGTNSCQSDAIVLYLRHKYLLNHYYSAAVVSRFCLKAFFTPNLIITIWKQLWNQRFNLIHATVLPEQDCWPKECLYGHVHGLKHNRSTVDLWSNSVQMIKEKSDYFVNQHFCPLFKMQSRFRSIAGCQNCFMHNIKNRWHNAGRLHTRLKPNKAFKTQTVLGFLRIHPNVKKLWQKT